MFKKSLISLLVAGTFAAPAAAQPTLLTPGVTYEQQLQFTRHGPVLVHVLIAPKPNGLWQLKPMLSNGTILGRERVTSMQRRASASSTVAGVNGDLFQWADGIPTGVLMQNGELKSAPAGGRSSVGIDSTGNLLVDRVSLSTTWQGLGQRRLVHTINRPSGPNGNAIYTPAFGPATPLAVGSVEAVLSGFPTLSPNSEQTGLVSRLARGGGTAIPSDGAVLVARGTQAEKLTAEGPVGEWLTVRLVFKPDWSEVVDAVGGGPLLVRNAKPVFRALEEFTFDQLSLRHPRTGVGQRADGKIVLVAVDGRRPGYSVGLTNFELAQTLVRLGVVTGSALDAGGSTTMAFDGKLLNRPSDPGGERSVAEALLVHYYGVHAPPATVSVVSPNGDGVGEQQSLVYKIVRRSTVNASLLAPDGTTRSIDSGPRPAGLRRFTWNGQTAAGLPEPEGRWRWLVTATDDLGRASQVERSFWLNSTLGSLRVSPGVVRVRPRGGRLVASFVLTRPASIRVAIETTRGEVLRTLTRRSAAAGPVRVVWNGKYGNRARTRAFTARHVLRVTATNEIGKAELKRIFGVVRVDPPKPKKSKKPS